MSDQPKLYVAGVGMITPVGFDTASTAAAVRAGVSGYSISEFYGQNNETITMASVPNSVFTDLDVNIDEGDRFNERHDRVIKMTILAIREACATYSQKGNIPMVLAMPEDQTDNEGLSSVIENLENNCKPWINGELCRWIHGGRAAGIQAIDFAFHHINDLPGDYFLVGGGDSYQDDSRIYPLSQVNRLKTEHDMDGFVPGEAAGFLLLTCRPELAMLEDDCVIAVNVPGLADEQGCIASDEYYRGDGLDEAFKNALQSKVKSQVDSIYSSMNGENYWAKEYGVAFLRNKTYFSENTKIVHPADVYGDLGAATIPVMIALAAEELFNDKTQKSCLVYGSSDTSKRGAVLIEKLPAASML